MSRVDKVFRNVSNEKRKQRTKGVGDVDAVITIHADE